MIRWADGEFDKRWMDFGEIEGRMSGWLGRWRDDWMIR